MAVQYIVYCIYNGGKPFHLYTYDKIDLYNMV